MASKLDKKRRHARRRYHQQTTRTTGSAAFVSAQLGTKLTPWQRELLKDVARTGRTPTSAEQVRFREEPLHVAYAQRQRALSGGFGAALQRIFRTIKEASGVPVYEHEHQETGKPYVVIDEAEGFAAGAGPYILAEQRRINDEARIIEGEVVPTWAQVAESDEKAREAETPTRANCPSCGFRHKVRKDGTMSRHDVFVGDQATECTGTGTHWSGE